MRNSLIPTHWKLDKNITSKTFPKNQGGSASLSDGCGIRETEPVITFKRPKLPALCMDTSRQMHRPHNTKEPLHSGLPMGSTSETTASHRNRVTARPRWLQLSLAPLLVTSTVLSPEGTVEAETIQCSRGVCLGHTPVTTSSV